MIDKNQAFIDFLLTCPTIKNNPLFFNFANAQTDVGQLITMTDDIALREPYIDGSVLKRYTISLVIYKSVAYNAIVKATGYPDENISDLAEVQKVLDWITEQADNGIYPNFGPNYTIDKMEALTEKPTLDGVDTSLNPPLATYSIGVRIQYIDTTKMIWK